MDHTVRTQNVQNRILKSRLALKQAKFFRFEHVQPVYPLVYQKHRLVKTKTRPFIELSNQNPKNSFYLNSKNKKRNEQKNKFHYNGLKKFFKRSEKARFERNSFPLPFSESFTSHKKYTQNRLKMANVERATARSNM